MVKYLSQKHESVVKLWTIETIRSIASGENREETKQLEGKNSTRCCYQCHYQSYCTKISRTVENTGCTLFLTAETLFRVKSDSVCLSHHHRQPQLSPPMSQITCNYLPIQWISSMLVTKSSLQIQRIYTTDESKTLTKCYKSNQLIQVQFAINVNKVNSTINQFVLTSEYIQRK
jgi:hypothetical protein